MTYLDDGLPNLLGALMVHLKASTSIVDLIQDADLITAVRANVPAKSWGIVVADAGGPAPDMDVPLMWQRVDVKCFGPNPREAKRLESRVYAYLHPPSRRRTGFTAAHCRVLDSRPDGGVLELVDDNTDKTPFVIRAWLFLINEVAVA